MRSINHSDVIGKRYGRLLVKGFSHEILSPNKGRGKYYYCICDCGSNKIISLHSLRNAGTKSCGCLQKEVTSNTFKKHSMSNSKVYKTWARIRNRCNNKNSPDFKYYGERGIEVCPRWSEFENFYKDMGDPKDRDTIERVDVEKGYNKENCEWIDKSLQNRNKRNNVFLECRGENMCLPDWADKLGTPAQRIRDRLILGWEIPEALFAPKGYRKGKFINSIDPGE